MKPVFIINEDGLLLQITDICNCSECQRRGEVEFRVEDLDGGYVDYIKFHELETYVKNISYDMTKLDHENDLYRIIAVMLHEELLRCKADE